MQIVPGLFVPQVVYVRGKHAAKWATVDNLQVSPFMMLTT
jgi:hypothetical protein